MSNKYEVLNPWAEVDPVPLKGISPRVTDLTGRKVGLLFNGKRASRPILTVVERELQKRFPSAEFDYYGPTGNREMTGTEDKASYEDWAKGVDAVIAAVGD